MRRLKRVLGTILVAFGFFSLAYAAWVTWKGPGDRPETRAEEPRAGQVIVYFIHGRAKCPTCDLILAHTRNALASSFREETEGGSVVLRPVDVEKPGNEHFMEDFDLYTTSVVLFTLGNDGKPRWDNLEKAWELAEKEETFVSYLSTELRRFLKENSL